MMRFRAGLVILFGLLPACLQAAGRPIGLFVPVQGAHAESGRAVIAAARLALELIPQQGPPKPSLEVVETEEQWGRQTSRLVDLIYRDGVTVILGGVDNRSSHLAQQVVARARGRVLLILLSVEKSLTETGVPWVLRLVQEDDSSAGSSLSPQLTDLRRHFEQEYLRRHRALPPPLAYSAFATVRLLLSAHRNGKTAADEIQHWALKGTHQGLQGTIRFSAGGKAPHGAP